MAAGSLDCLLCHGPAHYLSFFFYTLKFGQKIGRQKPGMTYYALCDECIKRADKEDRAEKRIEEEYIEWAGTRNVVQ